MESHGISRQEENAAALAGHDSHQVQLQTLLRAARELHGEATGGTTVNSS